MLSGRKWPPTRLSGQDGSGGAVAIQDTLNPGAPFEENIFKGGPGHLGAWAAPIDSTELRLASDLRRYCKQIIGIHFPPPRMETLTDFSSTWDEVRYKLRVRYAQLSDQDVHLDEGKQEQLLERLMRRLRLSRDEIFDLIALA
jgi:hypothetical protein